MMDFDLKEMFGTRKLKVDWSKVSLDAFSDIREMKGMPENAGEISKSMDDWMRLIQAQEDEKKKSAKEIRKKMEGFVSKFIKEKND